MFIELHMIQNFAPSNLNRDDTGSPKDCDFGGYRRARISSQALKRAARTEFRDGALLPDEQLGQRTKRLLDELAGRLARDGRTEEQARAVAQAALASVKLTIAKENKTQYLLFLGAGEIAAVAALCDQNWDALVAVSPADGGEKGARAAKSAAKGTVPDEVRKGMLAALDGGRAADLALFGRMLADLPEKNVAAAAQVAHALSTHQVSIEFDYYTAVDDLRPGDTQGADMIGTVEFNSACFYRYSNVDTEQLLRNLGGDTELARATLTVYLRAAVRAIPSGKQNSMAAHNVPALVLVTARERGAWSLANAFVKPARPSATVDLIEASVAKLVAHWGATAAMYGDDFRPAGAWLATMTDPTDVPLRELEGYRRDSVAEVVGAAAEAAFGVGAAV